MGQRRRPAAGRVRWIAIFVLLLLACSAVPVLADEPIAESAEQPADFTPPTAAEEEIAATQVPDAHDVSKALGEYERKEEEHEEWLASPEAEKQRKDSQLAYSDLGVNRSEELLRSVFGERLAALNTDPSRFLSDAQLVRPLGESGAVVEDEGESSLLETTVPVRTEDEAGELAKVDLSLEATPEGFETENAVADLRLPDSANAPVQVGGEGFGIAQAGAAESPASRFGDKNLIYPSVLADTDLLVTANSYGAELFDLLRSKESPEDLSFAIDVPAGSELRSDEHGGAEVVREGERLILVPAPTAEDAQGTQVPIQTEVEGNSLVLHVAHRTGDYAYPLLVDPIVEDWVNQGNNWYGGANWGALGSNGPWKFEPENSQLRHDICCWEGSHAGLLTWTEANVFYGPEQYGQWVYRTENPNVIIPHIWLIPFNRDDGNCGFSSQPHDYAGLWSQGGGWSPLLVNYAKNYGNLSADGRGEALVIGESTGPPGVWISCPRILYSGGVGIWLDDEDLPELSTSSSAQWMDNSPIRLNVSASDAGVGVKSFEAWATNTRGTRSTWTTASSCTGLYGSRCPTTWNLGDPAQPTLNYDPSVLPEGIDKLSVKAYDATGKPSSTTNEMTIRVDHAPPTIALSGTLTEQQKLGAELPSYTLTADATDGVPNSENDAEARSGVVKLTFQENNEYVVQPVEEENCPQTQSCEIEQEIEVPAYKLPAGSHTIIVKATDALGHVATKEITYTTGDEQAPGMTLSGLPAEASGATYADYWSSFGSAGAGGGQFSHPAGMALDSNGDLWVVDENNKRVEKFNEAGEYLSSFGSPGTGNGQFGRPTDVGIDSKGHLWVTDAGNSRVEEFSESGGYLSKFGTSGTGDGQFNGPESIAIAPDGHIWVGDTYNGRLQEFDEDGEFIKVVSSRGTAEGQMIEPTGVAIGPDGDVWVADWGNNRVSVFDESGGFVRQFGASGSGSGQFSRPDVVDVDAQGDVWVGDQNNDRVQEFNQGGEYVTSFGSSGSGKGQFNFGWPMGIVADSMGSLWISDTGNNRVQRWLAPTATVTGQLDPIEAAATDTGFGVASVTAEVTSESGETEVLGETTQSCAKGQCPLALDLPEPDLSEKPAGAYLLTFSATDGAGNVRKIGKVIGLDPTPPAIAFSGTLAEQANQPLNGPDGDLTIEASDPAGSGVKTINVERDHQRVATYPYNCAGNCGEVTASYRYSAARDGTERSIQQAEEPVGATQSALRGVYCASATNCTAVGNYVDSTGATVTLAEHWDGNEWLPQATVNPAGATEGRLESVSCMAGGGICGAVGYYRSGPEAFSTLIEKRVSGEWSTMTSPNPVGAAGAFLYDISCLSIGDCWAVGKSTGESSGEATALVEHWDGSAWSIASLSEPPAQLRRVSCATSTSCVAVTGQEGLVLERWDGNTWTPENAAMPLGGAGASLSGVSCAAAEECTVVGSYDVAGHTAPLVERWDGSSWSVQESIDPAGIIEEEGLQSASPVGRLEGVSCKSSTSCTAFGSYRNTAQQTQPLAESWDGTEWALQPVPDPSETGDASTTDVSCFNGFECVAVGSYDESGEHALIESQESTEDSHRITVEAIDKYGATAVKSIDVDVPEEVAETPACSQETTAVAPKEPVTAPEAVTEIESALPRAVAASVPTTEETTEDEISPSYTPPQPNLESTGNLAEGETSVSPEGGVTLAGVACITPSSVTTAATEATVVHEDSAVFANTAPETSTIVRPTSGGASVIQAVEGPEAPESFSWNVTVPVGTELEKLPSGAVAIVKATEEEPESVAELPEPEGAETLEALNDAATQLETDEYQLASTQAETDHEVLAVIAEPWIVLRTNVIVPAPIEVVPDAEIPTEYVIHVIMPADEEQAAFFPVYLRWDATASASANGHCYGQSPCGDFDGRAAAQFAEYWGNPVHENARNPHFHNYGDNNCTNFLSQIMKVGNVKYMRAFEHGDGSWWYRNLYHNGQLYPGGYDDTESWRLADILPRHLWQYGLAHIDPVQQPWGWTKGDILAEDWFGTNGKGDFNHLQFVVGENNSGGHSREPLIANESSPGHNYSHQLWWRVRERIQSDEGGSGWTRVALAMKHTEANLYDKKHDPANLYDANGLFHG